MRIPIALLFGAVLCLANAAQAQILINGNFDQGATGWQFYDSGNYRIVGSGASFASSSITPPVAERSVPNLCRLGGFGYVVNSITQTVTLPNSRPLYLVAYYQARITNESDCGPIWSGARITVVIAGQTLTDEALCYPNRIEEWTRGVYDISAAAGQTISVMFKAEAANSIWSFLYLDDIQIVSDANAVGEAPASRPAAFRLDEVAPNPVVTDAAIRFALPQAGAATLSVYSIDGRRVATVVDGVQTAGEHEAMWSTEGLPAGMYLYRLASQGAVLTRRLLVIK